MDRSRARLKIELRLSDRTVLDLMLQPKGKDELHQADDRKLRKMMLRRFSGQIKKGGLWAVAPGKFINLDHIVQVTAATELVEVTP